MKKLLIIRHAKSSWGSSVTSDIDRPLNDRGHSEAPMMAKRLSEKKVKLDALISSPANRTLTTAGYFAKEYDIKKSDIIIADKLYQAYPEKFYEVIEDIDKDLDSVALFAHNPGITDFVNELTDTRIDDMPTCSVFAIKIPIKKWKDFKESEKEFWFFDSPKS